MKSRAGEIVDKELVLLLSRTLVQFLAPTLGGSQPPVIPAPGDPVPSLASSSLTYRHI